MSVSYGTSRMSAGRVEVVVEALCPPGAARLTDHQVGLLGSLLGGAPVTAANGLILRVSFTVPPVMADAVEAAAPRLVDAALQMIGATAWLGAPTAAWAVGR